MDTTFHNHEKLLRAVWPPNKRPDFWSNGRLSSAALKDKKGLSVNRTYDMPLSNAVAVMAHTFGGKIVSLSVPDCESVNAYLVYAPSHKNSYHSEIHGSSSEIELSDEQALLLARRAVLQYDPDSEYRV